MTLKSALSQPLPTEENVVLLHVYLSLNLFQVKYRFLIGVMIIQNALSVKAGWTVQLKHNHFHISN